MTQEQMLLLLKNDLQILTEANDAYLTALLQQAQIAITQEGIILGSDYQSALIQVQYAAYLFRKRAAADTTMPRFLRYQLNNMLMSQKGGAANDI